MMRVTCLRFDSLQFRFKICPLALTVEFLNIGFLAFGVPQSSCGEGERVGSEEERLRVNGELFGSDR